MTHDDLAWELRDLAHELDSSSARPVLSIDSHDTPWSYPGRTSYRDAAGVTHFTIGIDTELRGERPAS
jgi:hypothetical protein